MAQRDDAPQRPPEEWKSGGGPMSESPVSFLKGLSEDAGEPFDPGLSKAAASRRIDELLSRGRGSSRAAGGGSRKTRRRAPEPKTEKGGEDRMSDAQAAYLKELTDEEGGEFDADLSKEEAAR